jgi:hypothetical protein
MVFFIVLLAPAWLAPAETDAVLTFALIKFYTVCVLAKPLVFAYPIFVADYHISGVHDIS